MKAPLAALLVSCAALGLLLVGCSAGGPTPVATVQVHVVNHLSNVLVTKSDPQPGSYVGTLRPPSGFGYMSPCGGAADVQASIYRGGGDLVLAIDLSGVLDSAYPDQNLDPVDAYQYSLSTIWTNASLKGGEWIIAAPDGVTIAQAEPQPVPSQVGCGSWTYRETN